MSWELIILILKVIRGIVDLPDPQAELARGFVLANGTRRALRLAMKEALCPVCGDDLGSNAVLCRSCLTPHHLQCFTWNGRCSVYGCTEHRTFRAPPGNSITSLQFDEPLERLTCHVMLEVVQPEAGHILG